MRENVGRCRGPQWILGKAPPLLKAGKNIQVNNLISSLYLVYITQYFSSKTTSKARSNSRKDHSTGQTVADRKRNLLLLLHKKNLRLI